MNEDVSNSVTFTEIHPNTASQSVACQDSVHEVNSINLDLSVVPSGSSSHGNLPFGVCNLV